MCDRGYLMFYQKSAIVILALLFNACGYHLRGSGSSYSQELKLIYLGGGSTQFRNQFKNVLSSAKGKLSSSAQEAGIIIKVMDEDFNRRMISLSSRGRSNEVELNYHLTYELKKADKVLLSGQPIQIRREYFNDQEDIIAKDNEEIVIRDEMYQQAVQNILSRAQLALQESPK